MSSPAVRVKVFSLYMHVFHLPAIVRRKYALRVGVCVLCTGVWSFLIMLNADHAWASGADHQQKTLMVWEYRSRNRNGSFPHQYTVLCFEMDAAQRQ